LERYQEHYGHHPTSPQHLLAFVNNRGGSITYTTALRLMGQAGNVLPEPSPPRVTMRLERASATGPLPWWQDTLAINRHYRRLTRMIFTTLVTESNDASDSDVAAQVSLDLARRLLQLASPVSAQEGSSCAICLDKSDANEAVPWVQLPCEHVLHRKCFQELVSHNLFQCRCPLCRCDLVQRLLQE